MMMGIGMKMRRRGGVRATLASLLAKYGTNAHAWLPGAGVVDWTGSEHITSIPSGNNGWTPAFSGGVASGVKVSGASTGSLYCLTTGMQAGQWYCMTVVVSAISGTLTPQIGGTPLTAITTVGTHVRYEKYTSGAANYLDAPAATTATVTSWSIKPVTYATSTVSGLPTSNYLLSDGSTGYSSTDSVVGLVLDGLGALGSELVTNGSFATNDLTGWATLAGTWSAATGAAVCTAGTNSTISQNILTVGRTYQITLDVASLTGTLFVYAGASAASSFTTTGTKTVYLRCWGDTVFYVQFSSSSTGSVDNISVREITGIHASQATNNNKALLKKDAGNRFYWQFDATDLLTSTFPAGYESVTVIDAKSTGQVTTSGANIVGSYSIGPSGNWYGRIIVKGAITAADLAQLQRLANQLAGL